MEKIKHVFGFPYFLIFIFIFLVYIFLNVFINDVYSTRSVLFNNLKYGIPFLFFMVLVGSLIGININLIIFKFKETSLLRKGGSLTFLGVFGGLLGGACPGCFVGLFPAFIGLFGVSASLSVLPLYGIEIQMASSVLLITSIYLLTNENNCKIKFNGENK
tara:strand:+ start:162 stop:641 length:480 start_codon:yes stop_codon:yes gene_type:complete